MSAPTGTATAPARASRHGTLAGTATLLRFALRRDRVRLPVWVAALSVGTWSVALGLPSTAPTAADRAALAESSHTPAALAMNGPARYLTDFQYGAMLSQQMLGFVTLLVALLGVLTVVRHSRAEEETGRSELLRSRVVGRHAQLTAALTAAALAAIATGLATAALLATLTDTGYTTAGALLFGACYTAIGLVFAGVAAVTVQLSAYARSAAGMALAVLGAAYALRAAGDSSGDGGGTTWLSWLSPIGWVQRTYAYVDNRWWPLLLCLALAAATAAAGYLLSGRRDVGGSIVAARLGPPHASRGLTRPAGLALRLHRGLLLGFTVALVLFGAMYGAVLADAEDMLGDIEIIRDTLDRMGADSMLENFAAMVMLPLSTVAAVYAVMAALRARAEETAGRAEALLATGHSRARWLAGHLLVAAVGSTLTLLLGGLTFGLVGGLSAGQGDLVFKLAGAALAYAPALWTTAAVAALLTGWLPRVAPAAWLLPLGSFFLGYLGELLDLPQMVRNLDPFSHVPQLPADPLTWTPLLVLTGVAVAAGALALVGIRRRDLELK